MIEYVHLCWCPEFSVVCIQGRYAVVLGKPYTSSRGRTVQYADGQDEELAGDVPVVPVVTGWEAAYRYCQQLQRKADEAARDIDRCTVSESKRH
jgi:hypothetical protein